MLERLTVLCDIDGTLTPPTWEGRFAYAMSHQFSDVTDFGGLSMVHPFSGCSTELALAIEAVKRFHPDGQRLVLGEIIKPAEEFIGLMDRWVGTHATPITPYPGVISFLSRLTDRGVRLGVLSGNSRITGEQKLQQSSLDTYFDPGLKFWGYMDREYWLRQVQGHLHYNESMYPFIFDGMKDLEVRHVVCAHRGVLLDFAYNLINNKYSQQPHPHVVYVADTIGDVVSVLTWLSIPHNYLNSILDLIFINPFNPLANIKDWAGVDQSQPATTLTIGRTRIHFCSNISEAFPVINNYADFT